MLWKRKPHVLKRTALTHWRHRFCWIAKTIANSLQRLTMNHRILTLLLLACAVFASLSDAAVVQLPPVTVRGSNVFSGPKIKLSVPLLPDDEIHAFIDGTVDLDRDAEYEYSADVNAAGIAVVTRGKYFTVGQTSSGGVGALLIGNARLGFVQFVRTDASTGLGSEHPPRKIPLRVRPRDLWRSFPAQGLPAGTSLEFRVSDADDFNNSGAFVIKPDSYIRSHQESWERFKAGRSYQKKAASGLKVLQGTAKMTWSGDLNFYSPPNHPAYLGTNDGLLIPADVAHLKKAAQITPLTSSPDETSVVFEFKNGVDEFGGYWAADPVLFPNIEFSFLGENETSLGTVTLVYTDLSGTLVWEDWQFLQPLKKVIVTAHGLAVDRLMARRYPKSPK
jgi:hypothetical protein